MILILSCKFSLKLNTLPANSGVHGRMARGGQGLRKVSLGPAMPNASMPCGRLLPPWAPHAVRLWGGKADEGKWGGEMEGYRNWEALEKNPIKKD
jgi:hypothetical protein